MPVYKSLEEFKELDKKRKRPKVIAKVVSQKGICSVGHKVGDEFILGETCPPNMCLPALTVIYPYFRVLELGGNIWWSSDRNMNLVTCPDAENPVIFEVRRLRE